MDKLENENFKVYLPHGIPVNDQGIAAGQLVIGAHRLKLILAMHELSIAISIVDMAIKQAALASANQVSEVELDIGILSGIEYESLEFALEVASKDTLLEETLFRINRVEAVAECPECDHLYSPEGMFSHCPQCNKEGIRLIRGTELQIKSLLVEQNE